MTPTRARPLGPTVWVVRRQARFSIKLAGRRDYLVPPITQGSAMRIARLIARANKSELIVQGRSGRIRARDSHGCDPIRSRG